MWDYRDEEFCFADGWLVLRGPNGSGKTKALEVLFPFVLDGRIDPKRLNPFAAEDRTMKSNLLYRGGENAVGYVWLELRHRRTPARPSRSGSACTRSQAPRHPGPLALRRRRPGRRGLLAHHRRRPADDQEAAGRGDRGGRACTPPPPITGPPSTSACSASARERYEQLLTLDPDAAAAPAGQEPRPGEAVGHAHRRPAPGRRRPDRRGGPLVRRHGGGRHHAGGPDGRRRGHPTPSSPATPPTCAPTPGRPPTRSPGAARPARGAENRDSPSESRPWRPRKPGRRRQQAPPGGRRTRSPGCAPGIDQLKPSRAYQAVEQLADLERLVRTNEQSAAEATAELARRQHRDRPRPVPSRPGREARSPTAGGRLADRGRTRRSRRRGGHRMAARRRTSRGVHRAGRRRAHRPAGSGPRVRAAIAERTTRPSRPAIWPGSHSTGRWTR